MKQFVRPLCFQAHRSTLSIKSKATSIRAVNHTFNKRPSRTKFWLTNMVENDSLLRPSVQPCHPLACAIQSCLV
ncbi:hypothetical protein CRM22_008458, partial [Opisthorchis felineus]